jgi:hypothetical protein
MTKRDRKRAMAPHKADGSAKETKSTVNIPGGVAIALIWLAVIVVMMAVLSGMSYNHF